MREAESPLLRALVGPIFFLANVMAVFLLLRGHDLPGGGFIAGLVTAISFILLGLTRGLKTVHNVLRVDPVHVAAAGLLLAVGTAAAPMFWGFPFFHHLHWNLGDILVGTPLLFDLGVYGVVVGIAVKMVLVFAKSVTGLAALVREDEARYASVLEQPIEENPAGGGPAHFAKPHNEGRTPCSGN
jgi:multicomponent Na+:H+ antiporter subunit B